MKLNLNIYIAITIMGKSLITFFWLISIFLSSSDQVIKITSLNIERA